MDFAPTPTIAQEGLGMLTLLQILSNPYILYNTVPYLPVSSLLALGGSSQPFRELVHHTPGVFRYLDLSPVKSVQFVIKKIDNGGEVWRNVQLDENVTEDDFYAGPLRGVFGALKGRHVLQDVQTLILDGLSVTSELISEIILEESFNVRLLSLREVQNLNEKKLMQALEYSVRPTRPAGMPRLQGLYIFGKKNVANSSTPPKSTRSSDLPSAVGSPYASGGVTAIHGAQLGAQMNQRSRDTLSISLGEGRDGVDGRLPVNFAKPPIRGWAETILACKGLISFDAILCTGPRHTLNVFPREAGSERQRWYEEYDAHLPAAVATVVLQGCSICHSAPELTVKHGGEHMENIPLITPPPLHSSTLKAATRLRTAEIGEDSLLIARCTDCIRGRYCESCHKWWCEDCYRFSMEQGPRAPSVPNEGPGSITKIGAWRDCFGCGINCNECITGTQRRCKFCRGGYCTIHNEGSTITTAGRHAINGCRR